MEIIILIEGVFYNIAQCRIGEYKDERVCYEAGYMLRKYLQRGMIIELIALIPINIIFYAAGMNEHVIYISIWRLSRNIQFTRITGILTLLGTRYTKVMSKLKYTKPILLLVTLWHCSAMFWMWVNTSLEAYLDNTYWLAFLELGFKPISEQYFYCLQFVMSIVTTTGYPEQLIYNDFERLIFIGYYYMGAGLFSLAFGMISANSSVLSKKYETTFPHARAIESLSNYNTNLPFKQKLKQYYAYLIEFQTDSDSLVELRASLPSLLVNEVLKTRSQMLKQQPLFVNIESQTFFNELINGMESLLYLPGDYVVQRGEFGSGMFLVIEGKVNIFSTNERTRLYPLKKGDFFGERSLLGPTRWMHSIVSKSYS